MGLRISYGMLQALVIVYHSFFLLTSGVASIPVHDKVPWYSLFAHVHNIPVFLGIHKISII